MKFSSLLADIRLYAPGLPEMWQYRFLSRALQEWLSHAEVWKEWTAFKYDFTAASGGRVVVPNAKYDPATPANDITTVRTNRVHKVRWEPTQELIPYKTLEELDTLQTDWATQTAKKPLAWTVDVSGFAGETVPAVRLYPYPAIVGDNTTSALSFFVSHTVTECETLDDIYAIETTATAGIADWIFRRYREGLVAGALSKALLVPNVDWSNPGLAQKFEADFERAKVKAKSEADVGQSNWAGTVVYGGY